jgi:hypothetical protein
LNRLPASGFSKGQGTARGSGSRARLRARSELEGALGRADRGVTLIDEIAWDNGVRCCYFNDPAGNPLEIAARDLWTA